MQKAFFYSLAQSSLSGGKQKSALELHFNDQISICSKRNSLQKSSFIVPGLFYVPFIFLLF